jgi:phosphatidylglycerophosphate synthase
LRLALTVPCAHAIRIDAWRLAAALFAVAVATDVFDGIVARRRGEASSFGALLDHATDALFVTVTLGALATIELVTPLLPVLAIASFVQYVWDSRALSGAPLRASVLGRWNGIGYFVLVGVATISHALSLDWPPALWLAVGAWLLVASTLASMADRGYALWRVRRRATHS